MQKYLLTLLIISFAIMLNSCQNDEMPSYSAENATEVSENIADANIVTSAETDNETEETGVASELMDQLIEMVQSMQPVMKWFVYGCDVIEVNYDVKYFLDDGTYYYKINDPEFSEAGINSIDSLKEYLNTYFTAEYVDNIMERYDSLFTEVDADLYVVAASAGISGVFYSPDFFAEYQSDNEIKLSCNVEYRLFNAEPEPYTLIFEFIQRDGKWLINLTPNIQSYVRIIFK